MTYAQQVPAQAMTFVKIKKNKLFFYQKYIINKFKYTVFFLNKYIILMYKFLKLLYDL